MLPTCNGPGTSNINQMAYQSQNEMYQQSLTHRHMNFMPQQNQPIINLQMPSMNHSQFVTGPGPTMNYNNFPPYVSQQTSVPLMNASQPVLQTSFQGNTNLNDEHRSCYEEFPVSSGEDDEMNEPADKDNRHPWQAVKKRKRNPSSKVTTKTQVIDTSNRYQALTETNNARENNENQQSASTNSKQTQEPKPPPIYIYGVTDFKAMTENLAQVVEDEQYYSKAMGNNTVRINPTTPEVYRKLVHHLRAEKIVHHTYQLKQERAYRVVIRDLHHSVPLDEITEQLSAKGHKIRNIINVRHRISKDPLPMFFVDLEPQANNKDVYEVQFLSNTKVKIEPPRPKRIIIQCTRCQAYGHSKTYCLRPYNCVKCGQSHDSKTCKKTRETLAKCALCDGDHPANYKGCTVYRDLQNARNGGNRGTSTRQTSQNQVSTNRIINQQARRYIPQQTPSYAQVTENGGNDNRVGNSQNLEDKLTHFLNEFKNLFSQLMSQNNMILTLLTSVINKKC